MKDLIKRVANADAQDWLVSALIFFVACLISLAVRAMAADHVVRCYYPLTIATSAGNSYQLMGDVNWGEDKKAYSTTDGDKMLEVLQSLKQCSEI